MKKEKYMMSGGLAFSEQNDLKKLRQKAAQGWMVKRFKFMGYQLEHATPEDVIFSIDYRDLNKREEGEYFEMFEVAGWRYVCSNAGMHLFKAVPGTKPIYSDRESAIDKLVRKQKPLMPITLICVLFSVVSYLLSQIGPDMSQPAFHMLFLLSTAAALPALLTTGAVSFQLWRERRIYA